MFSSLTYVICVEIIAPVPAVEQHMSDKIYLLSSPSANLIGLCIFTFFHLTELNVVIYMV